MWNKIWGKKIDKERKPSKYDRSERESVIVWFFHYEYDDLNELFEVQDKLGQLVEENGLGICDGNEIALEGTDGSLWFYGPSAEKLFAAIRPILQEIHWMKGAVATLTFGSSRNAKRIEVTPPTKVGGYRGIDCGCYIVMLCRLINLSSVLLVVWASFNPYLG